MSRSGGRLPLFGAVLSVGIVGLILVLPLPIVRYHTLFWELSGRYTGVGWSGAGERVLDAVVNVVLFVPLGFVLHRWRRRGARATRSTVWHAMAIGAAGAAGAEFIQLFLPWRHAALMDVAMNIIGTSLGIALDYALALRPARRSSARPRA